MRGGERVGHLLGGPHVLYAFIVLAALLAAPTRPQGESVTPGDSVGDTVWLLRTATGTRHAACASRRAVSLSDRRSLNLLAPCLASAM